jgi:C4-dicarboxylate-specific signal transduction histidine kinase
LQFEATHANNGDGKSDRGSPPLGRIARAWRSLPRLLSGIGWRLLVRVLLLSSVITLLLTLVQLYLDYRRDVQAIDLRMFEIDSVYSRSLSDGLWRVDARQLRLQVEGILHLPDISYVELREATDRIAPLLVTAGSQQANPSARHELRILYTNRGAEQLLGILVVEATYDRIYRRLLSTVVIIMVGQALKTFLVSFFILLFVHQLITRHLTAIATSLREYDLGGSRAPLQLERRPPRPADELDDLVGAFNQREMALREGERRNLDTQTQLAHANRIATMGQLAASLAHEVNQPIGATLMNAGTAQRWLAASPPNLGSAGQSIDRIIADTRRAADIVGRIRDLAKKAPAHRESLEINEVVLLMIGLTRTEMSNNGVSLRTRLTDGLPSIPGDRVQLQQVILNLIMNAIEAMSEVSEGSRALLISTSEADSDGVLVMVSDSGPGLPHADPERIFDAFYTTKASGLGMGLSICRSIVEAHGGWLSAAPNEPRGAVFCMTLPIGEKSIDGPEPSSV